MTKLMKLILAGLALWAVSGGQSVDAGEIRTNILFIFADDWGWGDLGCHGHPYVKTPNIDRLAEQGTDFHRFTVASGVCSPSRTAVMTGQFPARYNIQGHFAWVPSNARRNMPDWLDPQAPLLSRFLSKAGYRTGHFGKWHLANDMIPDSPPPSHYGFDAYGAFNCSGKQMPVHEDAQQVIRFIEESQRVGRPFFVNLWLHEPHTPFHTLPQYRKRFSSLEERDNIYASVLSHADDRVGEVLAALDRLRLTDHTLVVFSSDNGPARDSSKTPLRMMHDTATGDGFNIAAARGVTGGRKAYKASLFEGGIGVPFIARWPGNIPAGRVDKKSILSAVDLLPTFCEIGGVSLPVDYQPDGISQVNTLKGQGNPLRTKPLFWKVDAPWPARKTKPDHWAAYAVVSQKWKLLTNRNGSHLELYDLLADPLETQDLRTQRPAVVKQMAEMLTQWKSTLPAKPVGDVFSSLRNSKKGN
ncbi:MAG: sulfatase-like hydrolase/transferase [Planctomycetota bacterium]|nr:sulfatase-like hydrolase/transferase [Planctomycetota bacterium]